jgi:hypothetical protein
MKFSRILICKLFAIGIVALPTSVFSQTVPKELSIQGGIYDFTDETSREFYKIAPSLSVAWDVYKRNNLSFSVLSGLSHSSVKYNSRRHHMNLVQLNFLCRYVLTQTDTKIRPYMGSGLGVFFKSDKNKTLNRTHHSFMYGYLINTGIDFPMKNDGTMFLDLKFVFVIPSESEEINVSGVSPTLGIRIPINGGRKK